jgi:serine/threonine protein kinase
MPETPPDATLTSPTSRVRSLALARGDQLDRYVILERVGEGGMGAVFAAYDSDLDRKVALKLLRSEGSNAARARLLREAKSMARLSHPNARAPCRWLSIARIRPAGADPGSGWNTGTLTRTRGRPEVFHPFAQASVITAAAAGTMFALDPRLGTAQAIIERAV